VLQKGVVRHELGQLEPGVELFECRIVGQLDTGRLEDHTLESRRTAFRHALSQLLGDEPRFVGSLEARERVQPLNPRRIELAPMTQRRTQHRDATPNQRRLVLERVDVELGRRPQVARAAEHAPNRREVDVQFAQRPHDVEPRAVRIRVHAVPRRGAPWSQKPELFIVPKNLRAQPRGARQCTDRQRFFTHPLTLQCL
jgi:hypothetical protein